MQNERPCVVDDEIAVLDRQVGDRNNDREVPLEGAPARAVVERNVEAGLGTGVSSPSSGRRDPRARRA